MERYSQRVHRDVWGRAVYQETLTTTEDTETHRVEVRIGDTEALAWLLALVGWGLAVAAWAMVLQQPVDTGQDDVFQVDGAQGRVDAQAQP